MTFDPRNSPVTFSFAYVLVCFAQDLHRMGCSSYCGQEGEQDRVVLKRVLLAYARWNKAVGYCQGFNVLAALILEVTEGSESDALKVSTRTNRHARTQKHHLTAVCFTGDDLLD